MVLINNLHKMVEHGTFSLQFVAETGELVTIKECICTSWHSSGRTMNIKIIPSNEIRTIRRCTILTYNDEEVML